MKIKNRFGLSGTLATALLSAALFTSMNVSAAADITGKGTSSKLNNVQTIGDIETFKTGDVMVMACPKCRTITETRIEMNPKGASATKTKVPIHACPGCSAKWEVTGTGKAQTEKVTHVCTHCGDTGAMCAVKKTTAAKE